MEPRLYIRDRSDRRVSTEKFNGVNQRKNIGRRTQERRKFLVYKSSMALLVVTLVANISFITYSIITS